MSNITKDIIVELRQINKYAINAGSDAQQNGDWNVEINKPIDIEEGDIVSVNSVFVDDNSTGLGLINVEEDVSGAIEVYQYFFDCQPSSNLFDSPETALGIRSYVSDPSVHPLGNHPDGHHYFLSELTKTQADGGQNIFLCSQLALRFDAYQASKKSVFVKFEYEYPKNTVKTIGLTLKKDALKEIQQDAIIILDQNNLTRLLVSDGNKNSNPANFKFPFMFASNKTGAEGGDNYVAQSPALDETETKIRLDTAAKSDRIAMRNSGVLAIGLPTYNSANPTEGWELVTEPRTLSLRTRTATFDIKKGKYDPSVLAQQINQQIVSVGAVNNNSQILGDLYDPNKILTTTKEIFDEGSGVNTSQHPYFIREDGAIISQFTADQSSAQDVFWVGASNFGVEYAGNGRFEFKNLHQSRYTSAPVSQVVTVESIPNTTVTYLANKCGGVVFKDLRPNNFWIGDESVMGFSPSILAHSETGVLPFTVKDPGSVTARNVQAEFFGSQQLQTGVNITGDLNTLDVLVNKEAPIAGETKANAKAYYDKPGASIVGQQNAIVQQIGIFGRDIMEGSVQANAYYKIEIDMPGVNVDLRGADLSSNKIQAIIGRFYAGATFTQAVGGEGSIPYIHKGPPLKLSHFGCRILMPDGKTVAPLGPDNTIFISVTKPK